MTQKANSEIKKKIFELLNEKNLIFAFPDTDQEEVALLVSRYDITSIPVINKEKVILGIITIDDIIDVIIEEQTEDLLMISGVGKNEKVYSTFYLSV